MDTTKFKNPYVNKLKEGKKTYTYAEAINWVGGDIDVVTGTMKCLEEEGLSKHDSLLDFGCGCFRIGAKIIEKIGAKNYYAMDADEGLIDAGLQELQRKGISTAFTHVVSSQFEFQKLRRKGFDFILAQGVITHMPDPEVVLFFKKIDEYLRSGGKALVSFIDKQNGSNELAKGTFHHKFIDLIRLNSGNNLKIENIPFSHPRGLKMLLMVKK